MTSLRQFLTKTGDKHVMALPKHGNRDYICSQRAGKSSEKHRYNNSRHLVHSLNTKYMIYIAFQLSQVTQADGLRKTYHTTTETHLLSSTFDALKE